MEPHELMQSIIDAKPVDFDKNFAELMQGRVSDLVANKKFEVAQSFFPGSEPKEVEPDASDDNPDEVPDEVSDDEPAEEENEEIA